jgi:RHS repeat-associated protein
LISLFYRYGFNGKENDNGVKGTGNQQDYGMRIYDPRIGKFLSVDPIAKSYPDLTPYQFASNSPMENIDIDGLEKYSIHFKIEDEKNIITKVETNNSIRYLSVTDG